MARYDALEYGQKIFEFSSEKDALEWFMKQTKIGKIGKYKGKKVYSIRRSRSRK